MAGFGIFTVGSVLSLSQPDKFIDYISFVRIQVTQVDDSVMVSTAKEFGAATTFLAFLMALQSYCSVLVISPAAILESFFNFLQIIFIIIAPLSAFSTYQSCGVFQYPSNVLDVRPDALSYVVSAFFLLLGLCGIKLSQICARGNRAPGISLNLALGVYAVLAVLHMVFLLVALEPWVNHGSFEGTTDESARQQKSFATVYMVGIVVGFLIVLASLLLSAFHFAHVAQMLNSSFKSFKRTMSKRFPNPRGRGQSRQRSATEQAAWKAMKERAALQMSKLPAGSGHLPAPPSGPGVYPSPVAAAHARASGGGGGYPPTPAPGIASLQAPAQQPPPQQVGPSMAMHAAQQQQVSPGARYPSVHMNPEIVGTGQAFRQPSNYPNPLSET